MSRRLQGEEVEGVFQAFPQIEGALLQIELARLDLGKVEDVVDDRQERLAAGGDGVDAIALRFGQLGLGQDAGHADDAVHGRANFVAHDGQELALGLFRRLGQAREFLFLGQRFDQPFLALLQLEQRGFGSGDVLARAEKALEPAVEEIGFAHGPDPEAPAGGGDEFKLQVVGCAVAAAIVVGFLDDFARARRVEGEAFLHRGPVIERFVVDMVGLFRPVDFAARILDAPAADFGHAAGQAQQGFVLAQKFLRRLALGNIGEIDDDALTQPGRPDEEPAGRLGPAIVILERGRMARFHDIDVAPKIVLMVREIKLPVGFPAHFFQVAVEQAVGRLVHERNPKIDHVPAGVPHGFQDEEAVG